MSGNLRRLIDRQARQASEESWLQGFEARVAINEDPEHQHRIKVVIPALDEDVVYDKWVRSLSVWVLGPGFGSFFVPPIGSEVILFSRLGGKHNLFYLPAYNEDFIVPADFRDPAVAGIRAPGDLRFIAEADLQMRCRGAEFRSDAGAIVISSPAGVFINGKPY